MVIHPILLPHIKKSLLLLKLPCHILPIIISSLFSLLPLNNNVLNSHIKDLYLLCVIIFYSLIVCVILNVFQFYRLFFVNDIWISRRPRYSQRDNKKQCQHSSLLLNYEHQCQPVDGQPLANDDILSMIPSQTVPSIHL